jgi:hypothetical protein
MKKLLMAALALTMVMAVSTAYAQPKATLRLGGGIITDGSVPGGGLGLDITRSDNPIAFGFSGEFYSKSGVKTIPIAVTGMFRKTSSNGKATVFFGAGGGYAIYKVAGVSFNKPLASGLGGVIINATPKVGIFVKGQYYRIFSVNTNQLAVGGGIAINVGSSE